MFNKKIRKKQKLSPTGFRYRGTESTRLEHLTDAVFAFAITLLVIASEVPKTYVELQASMYGFVGFIACTLLLLSIWNNHSVFFLKYGLQDNRTKTLNFLFLFVLLFYIYPLKYLFSYIGSVQLIGILHSLGINSEAFTIALKKAQAARLDVDGWYDLMIRFGLGLLSIHSILVAMYWNALKKKEELQLNKREQFETKSTIYVFLGLMLISLTSIAIVVIGGGIYSGYAGLVYLMVPVNIVLISRYRKKKMNEQYPLKTKKRKLKKKGKKKVSLAQNRPEKKAVGVDEITSKPLNEEKIEPKIESEKSEKQ